VNVSEGGITKGMVNSEGKGDVPQHPNGELG
jgi:hypothetical protein